MTIDSQYLRVFCILARHLNMSRAAEELQLTPSSVSHCVKSLETDLGCRLFERSSRKVSLTAAGREFREEADLIVQKMSQARTRLKPWGDASCGRLRVAASATACQSILPFVLREFRESFPKYSVRIESCSARQGLEALTDERADLALMVEPRHHAYVQFLPAAEEELFYLVHPRHPWASQRKSERAGLAAQTLILPERDSDTYAQIEEYFRQDGTQLEPALEVGNEEAIKQLVQLNLGIAILPRWMAEKEIAQGVLTSLPLGRRRLRRKWGLLHARSYRPSFPESVFLDLCRTFLVSQLSNKVKFHS